MADNPQDTSKRYPIILHHEVTETFADQVGYMMCDSSILKIDFTVVRMSEPSPTAPPTGELHVVSRLVLSMGCAIDLINQMGKLAGQLAQAGIIKMEHGRATPQTRAN
jgi:hypothetical protein